MELSRTINSDKRYYLDENTIENTASFLQTMRVFNDAKIDLYNALYDQKYLASGPLIDHAYPVFLKEKYKTNDYYNAAVYSATSGTISSQKELKKYYSTTITADLKTRDEKIQTIQEALDKKKEMLEYIREQDLWLYHKLRYSILGRAANLPGRGGRKMFVAAYKVCQKFYGFN